MKKNRLSMTQTLALLLALHTPIYMQAQQLPATVPAEAAIHPGPPPLLNGGGVSPAGKRFDYRKIEEGKITYLRVLKTREEIDEYLMRQGAVDPDAKRLAEMPWTVMQHEWRRDPVTKSAPITKIPPPFDQQAELFQAIDTRLNLSSAAKEEFKKKIEAGACRQNTSLDPQRFVVMVNGTGLNEKIEVPAELAAKTGSCEFFIESEPVIINLVKICGNFGYVFVDVWWEATIPPPATDNTPNQASCELRANGQLITAQTPPFVMRPDGATEFTGQAVGSSESLQLSGELIINGVRELTFPSLSGNPERFTFDPKLTKFRVGRYAGSFDVIDQFGRRSSCPFVAEVNAVPSLPPSTFTAPPPISKVPELAKTPPPEKSKCPGWCKALIIVGAAALGAAVYEGTHGKSGPTKAACPGAGSGVSPSGSPTSGSLGSAGCPVN